MINFAPKQIKSNKDMRRKFSFNFVIYLIGIVCIFFTAFSFIKAFFKGKNINQANTQNEEWVEVPLITE